jgi:hypothetical protein
MGCAARMTPADYRAAIGDAICAALTECADVAAVWEGGSAATGRLDEYSDIDVVIVAGLEGAPAIFEAVEQALSGVDRIVHTWRVEPPPFRDTAQRFYFLAGAPRFFAVDCVIVTETAAPQFLELERHGEPRVLFDRTGFIRALPLDHASLAVRRKQRLAQLQGAIPVYRMLVEKELARNHPLEALGFYQALLRALIELLGMHHRPDRFDYGWRYVESELPADAQALIRRYAFVADGLALEQKVKDLGADLTLQLEMLSASQRADPPSP